jgi:DNA-binding Lrp family transcriptional regulator
MFMLDAVDRKIIHDLRDNGRASNAQIAKSLGLNAVTVAKRIDTLISDGIIAIKAAPNPFKLGYKAHAFITLNVDLTKVQSVCSGLIPHPNVTSIQTCFGRFDIMLFVDFLDWESLDHFIKHQLSNIEGIYKVETFLISDIKKRYHNLFDTTPGQTPVKIDEIDQQLIAELQQNGLMSYLDLAKKVSLSLSTVSRRVNDLIEQKIIRVIAVPNPSRLGFPANANLALNVAPGKIDSVCQKLYDLPNVYMLLTLMNGFEIIASVHLPTPELLYDFITNTIAKIDGVTKIETFVRAEIKKALYASVIMDIQD